MTYKETLGNEKVRFLEVMCTKAKSIIGIYMCVLDCDYVKMRLSLLMEAIIYVHWR